MQFQKMHSRHLKAVVDIEERLYPDPWTAKQLKSMLPDENARMFVVIEDLEGERTVVAYMILYCSNNQWIIENITVDEPYQRKGLGTELLALARKTIGPDKMIRMFVQDCYLGMHLLLKKMGYRAVNIEHADGDDFYQFELEATPVPVESADA